MPSTATSILDGLSASVAVKAPVKAVSSGNLTLSGEQTVGSVACVSGDRVLAKNQDTTTENGIYVVSSGSWTRAKDFDGNRDVRKGTLVPYEGSTNVLYRVTSANPIIIDTSAITFEAAFANLTQSDIAEVLNPQTDAEGDAAVTPSDYSVPSHEQVGVILPERYGLSTAASGATNRTAFESAIDVAGQLAGSVLLVPPGTYVIDATVTIDVDRVVIAGAGPNATKFSFNPASADVLFHFTRGATSFTQGGIRNVGFTSSNSVDKTAIQLDDARSCRVEEIGISQGGWLGSGSIGIHTKGRDRCTFRKLDIICARPLLMSECTNETQIDTDHFHFEDAELGSTETTGVIVEAADGVVLSNITFDGYQAWVLGKYGFYWNDTTSPIASHNIKFENVRVEQASDATGYCFHIASSAQNVQSVSFENCYLDSGRNGIYGRKLDNIAVRDCFFTGASGRTNLDITFQSTTELDLRGARVQPSSTITLTNAVQVLTGGLTNSSAPIPAVALYIYDQAALVSRKARREDGVLSFKYKGTVADDGQLNLPVLSSGGADLATFQIAMGSSTGPVLEYAFGAWRPGTVALTGSANTATSSSDGDLCVIDNTNALSVINRLGVSVDVVISVTWSD